VFGYGTGGYATLYAAEGVPRVTGFEIPPSRAFNTLLIANSSGVTIAGGNIGLATALTLTAGVLTTSPGNVLLLGNSIAAPPAGSSTSYVDGPLAVEFNVAAPTNRTFAIGKAGAFRPMILKSVNTGGISQAPRSSPVR
jgi:hypothetical protein